MVTARPAALGGWWAWGGGVVSSARRMAASIEHILSLKWSWLGEKLSRLVSLALPLVSPSVFPSSTIRQQGSAEVIKRFGALDQLLTRIPTKMVVGETASP